MQKTQKFLLIALGKTKQRRVLRPLKGQQIIRFSKYFGRRFERFCIPFIAGKVEESSHGDRGVADSKNFLSS